MVDTAGLQNLNRHDKIVNEDGTPTEFFMRILQGKTANSKDVQNEVDDLRSITVDTTAPITGGPFVFGDHVAGGPPLTIAHATSGVLAGSYKSADVTVDDEGHVTAIAEGGLIIEDEGTPISANPFHRVNFVGAGVTATDAGSGEATVTIPGGGGGGGGGSLGFSFSNTATAGLNILTAILIPNMSVTFTLAAITDVFIEFSCLLVRSNGRCRFILKIDGTAYRPVSANQNYYSNDQNENSVQNGNLSYIVNLAAGSHTIEIFAEDALAVATTTFWNRCLRVSPA